MLIAPSNFAATSLSTWSGVKSPGMNHAVCHDHNLSWRPGPRRKLCGPPTCSKTNARRGFGDRHRIPASSHARYTGPPDGTPRGRSRGDEEPDCSPWHSSRRCLGTISICFSPRFAQWIGGGDGRSSRRQHCTPSNTATAALTMSIQDNCGRKFRRLRHISWERRVVEFSMYTHDCAQRPWRRTCVRQPC